MKQTFQKQWKGHPYTVEIELGIPSVVFRVEGSMPPIVNSFENFVLETFYADLKPRGINPKKIKWFYEVKTDTEIHSSEVKLTPIKKNGQILFTDFKPVNIKIINL